mmetsp:Transcript_2023/g.3499  ORF Transcript_2023/g.3499 Transcript_2023/m.3499 type:complete len:105 (+) Transcript_2023:1417-1731(+)
MKADALHWSVEPVFWLSFGVVWLTIPLSVWLAFRRRYWLALACAAFLPGCAWLTNFMVSVTGVGGRVDGGHSRALSVFLDFAVWSTAVAWLLVCGIMVLRRFKR